jgi:hypothetical protein
MNYNPYAAPQGAPPQQPMGPGAGMPQPWEVGEVYGQAWEIFKKDWVILVFSWLLVAIIVGGPMQAGRFMFMPTIDLRHTMGPNEIIAMYQSMVPIYLFGFVFQTFFDVGLIRIQCAAARGETLNFATLFSGGSKFLPLLVVKLVLAILIGFFSTCLIVPGILVFVALWPVDYFVVDANQSISDAFKSAWAVTRGQWMPMFLFFLLGFLLYVGGFVACCIGWIATYPLYRVAKAIVFQRITGRGVAMPVAPPQFGQYPQQQRPPGAGYGPPPGGGGGYGPPGGGGGYPPPGGAPPGGAPPGGGWGPPR